jgi:hypothetical protein
MPETKRDLPPKVGKDADKGSPQPDDSQIYVAYDTKKIYASVAGVWVLVANKWPPGP